VTGCHRVPTHTSGVSWSCGIVIAPSRLESHGVLGCGAAGSAVATAGRGNSAAAATTPITLQRNMFPT
jgi:hypothetical protein